MPYAINFHNRRLVPGKPLVFELSEPGSCAVCRNETGFIENDRNEAPLIQALPHEINKDPQFAR